MLRRYLPLITEMFQILQLYCNQKSQYYVHKTSLCSQTWNTDRQCSVVKLSPVLCTLHTYCAMKRPVTQYDRSVSQIQNISSWFRNYLTLFSKTFFSVIYINITLQITNLSNIFCELDSKSRIFFKILIEKFRLCLRSSGMLRSLSW
jgi:hypothetical protein